MCAMRMHMCTSINPHWIYGAGDPVYLTFLTLPHVPSVSSLSSGYKV